MKQALLLPIILAAAALLILTGLRWGLPSNERIGFLMARPPDTAFRTLMKETREDLYVLTGGSAIGRIKGADSPSVTPAMKSLGVAAGWLPFPITPRIRAGFARPYFLRTNSTDEQMTVAALAGMHPGAFDFNPRIAQYGGLYIYGMGAVFLAADAAGLVTMEHDITYYFREPDEMGVIFTTGRAVNLFLALLSILFVFGAGRRLFSIEAGLIAAAALAFCPGFIFQAHFLKPYVMGCAAVACALYCSAAGWYIAGSIAAGLAAAAMPLYAPIALVPVIASLGQVRFPRFLAVLLLAPAVFFACNPYWIVNFREMSAEILATRSAYASHLSLDMLKPFILAQLPVSLSAGLAALTGAGILYTILRPGKRTLPLLFGGLLPLLFFAVIIRNQPATIHLSRFLLPWFMILSLPGAQLLTSLLKNRVARPLAAILTIGMLGHGALLSTVYAVNFHIDGTSRSTRIQAAEWIGRNLRAGSEIGIVTLPEPAFVPPMDFTRYHIEYLEAGRLPRAEYLVFRRDYAPMLHHRWRDHYRVVREFRPWSLAGHAMISESHVNSPFIVAKKK